MFGRRHRNEEIIINNGNGTTTVIEERRRGLFGKRQEQIITTNNGFGRGNTTIIEERGGIFGPREQIIINNGRRGGMGGTTIIEERGMFGPREEIIVNNRGMGGTTIIEEGGMFGPRQEVIINNNGFMGGGTTIIEEGGMFGPREQIIVNDGWGTTVIEEGGMFGREEIIINNNNGGYGMNQYGRNQYYGNQYTSPRNQSNPYQNQYSNQNQQYRNQNQQYQNNSNSRTNYNNQSYPNNPNPNNNYNNQQNSQNPQNSQQWSWSQQQQSNQQQKQQQQKQQSSQPPQQQQQQKPPVQQKPLQQQTQAEETQKKVQSPPSPPQIVQQQPPVQQVQQQKVEEKTVKVSVQETKQKPASNITQATVSQSTVTKTQKVTSNPPTQPAKPVSSLPTYPEICAFAYHFNRTLKNDPQLKSHIPMNPNNFFDRLQDGVVYCKFINLATKDRSQVPTISPMALNLKPKTERQAIENLNMAIDSAKSLGCYMSGINSQQLLKKSQQTVLSFVWEILIIHISENICFRNYPEICLLRNQEEDEAQFRKLGYQKILVRWLNYHCSTLGLKNKNITNLGSDLVDCSGFGAYLANTSSLEKSFWDRPNSERAKIVINKCLQNKVDTPIHHSDILSGKSHLNTILCYDIFTNNTGLVVETPAKVTPQSNTLKDRQIQMFGNWINSLGLRGVVMNDLIGDLKTGQVLLLLIDKIYPKSVDWTKFSNKFNSRVHIIQNCNYAIQLGAQKLGLKTVNVSGMDIVDGNVNLILGIVWQLCNIYWEKRVGKIVKSQLVEWANQKVSQQNKVSSLQDRSLSSGIYILQVVQSLKPKTVDFSLVRPANSEENIIMNINYCLSCVRKLGAEVIALWQHVYQVDSKFIALILAELRRLERASMK